jgi:hypothetical protein
MKTSSISIKVDTLPDSIRNALKSVEYFKSDVYIEGKETESVMCYASGDGRRGFTLIVNLETGECKTMQGSWGGSNMFNSNNAVDTNDSAYPMHSGIAVIKGSTGYPRTFASITLHPSNIVPLLPTVDPTLTDDEKYLLAQFVRLKPSYRDTKGKAAEAMIASLVSRGYLKQNKAGATQITTEGKNACRDVAGR